MLFKEHVNGTSLLLQWDIMLCLKWLEKILLENSLYKTHKYQKSWHQTVHFKIVVILPVLQNVPIHPWAHPKHVPSCMWHTLFLQVVGHFSLQPSPYTPDAWQPEWKGNCFIRKMFVGFFKIFISQMMELFTALAHGYTLPEKLHIL